MAMTSSPSSVSSLARIQPVQPSPTITTSFRGNFFAMCLSLGCPAGRAHDADRRQRETLIVTVDPVEIVVARAREADHFPRNHVAITAVDRIGKKALLHVLEDLGKKRLGIAVVEFQLFVLEIMKDGILVRIAQLRELFPAEL